MNPQGPPDFNPRGPASPNIPQITITPKFVLSILGALALLVGAYSSFYQVEAEEVGILLRLGKYHSTTEPGLRFKIPFGVDQVKKVAVLRTLKQEFGYGTPEATNRKQATSPQDQQAEKEMVTGDLNAALIEWVVQYRIQEPRKFLFSVRNPEETLRNASESIMRASVGDRTVDEVLTIGRQEIAAEALANLQDLVNRYEMGLRIDQVQLKNVNPPRQVQASFNEVNSAQQEKQEVINRANGQYNREVPKAGGEAERLIRDAQGYAIQRVNEAKGDAERFNALYTEYSKAPEITKQRLYLETMSEVIPNMGNKIIVDEDLQQLLPLLNLNDRTPNK